MAEDALYAGLAALLVLGLIEALEPSFVSRFFNLTWLVAWCVAASFLSFLTRTSSAAPAPSVLPVVVGLVGAWAVWQGFPDLILHWRIAATVGTLIVAFLMLVIVRKHK